MLDKIQWLGAESMRRDAIFHDQRPAGHTDTIIRHPNEGADDDFLWQIRMHQVAEGPPETRFPLGYWPGFDRILLLVEGRLMKLAQQDDGHEKTLERGSRLYCAGENEYLADTGGEGALLLDLLLRRKVAHGCVDLRHGSQRLPLRGGETIMYCTRGGFHLGLPPYLGGPHDLDAGGAMRMTLDYVPAYRLEMSPRATEARLLDVRINLYPGTEPG